MNLIDQLAYNVAPGPYYEADVDGPSPIIDHPVRLFAYYLPQFHAIPENDEWWGKGFTEWTNATKAIPRFEGHYQPHLPGELGFYDATSLDVLRRQAALAKRYGIAGFAFYHYWFGGRKILDRPLQVLLENEDIDLPFFLCWANDNWTRTWDGLFKDVLLGQSYSPEDDLAFAQSIEPAMRDPRYLRINGRPLLMLYKPSELPDAKATVGRWRAYFQSVGLPNPYIMMAQTKDLDPALYGMDAAAGFPPHGHWKGPRVEPLPRLFDKNFSGKVFQYEAMVERSAAHQPTEYRFMPGVCLSWDSEARRTGRGLVFHGSIPAKYGNWLASACDYVLRHNPPEERVVFINAWNEWAEGTHLEPDRHFGYAYLAETRRVLNDLADPEKMRARLNDLPKARQPTLWERARMLARRGARFAKRTIRGRLSAPR